jgi:SAM-dependent methyltransferase
MDSALRACPLCAGQDARRWDGYSPTPWNVVRCTGCDMSYLQNPVPYEALEEDFAWEKTYAAKAEQSGGSTPLSKMVRRLRTRLGVLHRDKQQAFRRWFNDGHVLDVGCGSGQRILPPMTPYGIELSKALHAQADGFMRRHGGYCAHGAGADTIWTFPKGHFDGILMFSYLEHEVEVHKVLTGAYHALKDSGAIFIRVPNFGSLNRRLIGAKWCGFRHPDHVNYFTFKTLTETCRRAGFSTQLINTISLPVDDNISVLLRKI